MSHSSVLSIVFESFYQLHNFLFYFLYNFSKFLNKKVPSLPHIHASKEGTFLISSLRTAFFYIFIQKMFCRTNRRCFFFIRTIFQIRNIPVKSIVRQYPLSQWIIYSASTPPTSPPSIISISYAIRRLDIRIAR